MPIGTIGGITAPFVNLLAAGLVYKSFTAQIEANKQQHKNHTEQMAAINKEQTVNYLLQLYESIEADYYSNERENDRNGWGNQLAFSLDEIIITQSNPSAGESLSFGISNANGLFITKESIGKVNYIYHNLVLLTDALLNSITKPSDKNTLGLIRYIAAKTENLFKSNGYDYLVNKDISIHLSAVKDDKDLRENLKAAKDGAEQINNNLSLISLKTKNGVYNDLTIVQKSYNP